MAYSLNMLIILIAIIFGSSKLSESTTRFFNDGSLHGWDQRKIEHKGDIHVTKGDCFDSSGTCITFSQLYDPKYDGRYHSELIVNNSAQLGRAAFYGFAFKLPTDWEFDDNEYTISQFITDFADVDCGSHDKGWDPTTKVWIKRDKLYTRLRTGEICVDSWNLREFKVGAVTPGHWQTVVISVSWTDREDGWFQFWLDGNLVVEKTSTRTMPDTDSRQFEFRVGMYPNWWRYIAGPPIIQEGEQTLKKVIIDNIGFGPTFDDANPLRED